MQILDNTTTNMFAPFPAGAIDATYGVGSIGPPPSYGGSMGVSRPWDMSLKYPSEDGGTVTASFSICCFMRGPIFWRVTGPQEVALPTGVGEYVIFVRIGTDGRLDGGVQISLSSKDRAEDEDRWCDTTRPRDGKVRVPLYQVSRGSVDDSWSVDVDYRDLSLNLYI